MILTPASCAVKGSSWYAVMQGAPGMRDAHRAVKCCGTKVSKGDYCNISEEHACEKETRSQGVANAATRPV